MVVRSRAAAQIHFRRGLCLCHWAGELRPAKPPSSRADEPLSARAPGNRSRLVHTDRKGHPKRTQRNTMSIRRRVPPLASSRRRPLIRTLGGPFVVARDTELLNSVDAGACRPTGYGKPPHSRDPITRPLRRSTTVHDSPSHVAAACHRVTMVLRGTHHSRVTWRV